MTEAERNDLLSRLRTAQDLYAPYLKNLQIKEAYETEEKGLKSEIKKLEEEKDKAEQQLDSNDYESFSDFLIDNEKKNIVDLQTQIDSLKGERANMISQETKKSAFDLISEVQSIEDEIETIENEIRATRNDLQNALQNQLLAFDLESRKPYVEESKKLQAKLEELETKKSELEKRRKSLNSDLNQLVANDTKLVGSISRTEAKLEDTKQQQMDRVKDTLKKQLTDQEKKINASKENLETLKEQKGSQYKAAKDVIKSGKDFFEKGVKADIEELCEKLGIEVSYEAINLKPEVDLSFAEKVSNPDVPVAKVDEETLSKVLEGEPAVLTKDGEIKLEKQPENITPSAHFAPEKDEIRTFIREKYKGIKILKDPVNLIKSTVKCIFKKTPEGMGIIEYANALTEADNRVDKNLDQIIEERQQEHANEIADLVASVATANGNTSPEPIEAEISESKETPALSEEDALMEFNKLLNSANSDSEIKRVEDVTDEENPVKEEPDEVASPIFVDKSAVNDIADIALSTVTNIEKLHSYLEGYQKANMPKKYVDTLLAAYRASIHAFDQLSEFVNNIESVSPENSSLEQQEETHGIKR